MILLGREVELKERSAMDVLNLAEYKPREGENPKVYALKASAIILRQSITIWIESHSFFKRWYMRRKYSVKALMKALNPRELEETVEKIFLLEGIDVKKKAKGKQSLGKSQKTSSAISLESQ